MRGAIEKARKESAEPARAFRRGRESVHGLPGAAGGPDISPVAVALTGEGLRFNVFTPADSVRLSSEGTPGGLPRDGTRQRADPPAVMGRTSRGRGRRAFTSERPVRDGAAVGELTRRRRPPVPRRGDGPFVER